MVVTINKDDEVLNFDINNIADDAKKQEATVIVQKVGNLQVVIEALDFASRTHRANLEQLLEGCEEAKVEAEATEEKSEA
jgi:ribonuclease PH